MKARQPYFLQMSLLSAVFLFGTAAVAQESDWVDLPPPSAAVGMPAPEVVISHDDVRRVKEYRVNGSLYMIEVIPDKGPSYYLVDMDGDGSMDTRRSNVEAEVAVPRWVIFSWQ